MQSGTRRRKRDKWSGRSDSRTNELQECAPAASTAPETASDSKQHTQQADLQCSHIPTALSLMVDYDESHVTGLHASAAGYGSGYCSDSSHFTATCSSLQNSGRSSKPRPISHVRRVIKFLEYLRPQVNCWQMMFICDLKTQLWRYSFANYLLFIASRDCNASSVRRAAVAPEANAELYTPSPFTRAVWRHRNRQERSQEFAIFRTRFRVCVSRHVRWKRSLREPSSRAVAARAAVAVANHIVPHWGHVQWVRTSGQMRPEVAARRPREWHRWQRARASSQMERGRGAARRQLSDCSYRRIWTRALDHLVYERLMLWTLRSFRTQCIIK